MTIGEWLKKTTKMLEDASIPTARLDAEVLLADALKKDRAWVLAHPEEFLQGATLQRMDKWVKRRVKHEPIAYIRGKQEFYGQEFFVTPDTLTPRPETETMVELALEIVNSRQFTVDSELQIVDVGTGSGCIVITVALELKNMNMNYPVSYLGLDISEAALTIARKNAQNLGVDIEFKHYDLVHDDLLSAVDRKLSTLVVANLPYVPVDFQINLDATHEPEFAIYGGMDGLEYYRHLFNKLSRENKYVITESLPPQHESLAKLAEDSGYELRATKDLIQVFRRV